MTTTHSRSAGMVQRGSNEVEPGKGLPQQLPTMASKPLSVVWILSARALASRPALASGSQGDLAGGFVKLTLGMTMEPDGSLTSVNAKVGEKQIANELTEGAAGVWTFEGGLLHLDVAEPTSDTPLLAATLRVGPEDHVQVMYARTTLLAWLGVPGGRYEVEQASFEG